MRKFLPLASSVYMGDKMDFSELKPRNRTQMAIVACLGGFVGVLSGTISATTKVSPSVLLSSPFSAAYTTNNPPMEKIIQSASSMAAALRKLFKKAPPIELFAI